MRHQDGKEDASFWQSHMSSINEGGRERKKASRIGEKLGEEEGVNEMRKQGEEIIACNPS